MKEIKRPYPAIATASFLDEWKPIKDFGFITLEHEKNDTISLQEILAAPGEPMKYQINLQFDFPGLEGGSQENLEAVTTALRIAKVMAFLHHSVTQEWLKGRAYFNDESLRAGDKLGLVAETTLWYSDGVTHHFNGPLRVVTVVE